MSENDIKIIVIDGKNEYLGIVSEDGLRVLNVMEITGMDIDQDLIDLYVKRANTQDLANLTLDINSSKMIRDLNDSQKMFMSMSQTVMLQAKEKSLAMWENEVFDRLRDSDATKVLYRKPSVGKGLDSIKRDPF